MPLMKYTVHIMSTKNVIEPEKEVINLFPFQPRFEYNGLEWDQTLVVYMMIEVHGTL